ncbi:hypothetical protein [Salipaludibacillus aurantiacus]|uniref:hypothetical protein n=1 Tax=Salipaludibacillus aurantiacus TaxID=1601833 RepID=UPI0015A51BC4|nr:hypothetical protein [Salipaludibacillus aurantiacus]
MFLIAHRDFAIEAFELLTADYLVKRKGYERLYNTIERLKKRSEVPSIKNG